MLEHKNTIIAIVLSLIVVVGWQYFIGYPKMEKQRREALLKQQEQAQLHPPAAESTPAQPVTPAAPGAAPNVPAPANPAEKAPHTREAIVGAAPHVAINTERLNGSIDLKGARIDNLSLEQYRETVDPNSPPIVLFSPSGTPDAYYAEFGWVPAAGTKEKMPGPDTIWTQEGTGAL